MERIEKLNNNFSNIGTVVFYKHHEYIPDSFDMISGSEDLFRSDLVKYHGSKTNFSGINFAEYDFSYLIDKYKFNNRLLISDLDDESSELVGRDIEDTDKLSKILFPTLVDSEIGNPYEYFGSLYISNYPLYFFECPELYQTIEIYEDILDSNILGGDGFIEYRYLELEGRNDIISPSIIINLGPLRNVFNNPTEFYFDRDPLKNRINRTKLVYSALDYSKLCDEIWSRKIVSFLLSNSGDIFDFNLSYASWENNDNPLRNKWKTEIRNDEFWDIINQDKSIIRKDGDLYFDKKTDTFLGNTIINSSLCPIISNKLDKLQRTQSLYYSPYRKYSIGDNTTYKVLHSDGTYTTYVLESLVNGNIGNDPLLSPAWILKDKFLDFISNIIYININPANTGSVVNPGTQITVVSDSVFRFSIIDGIGYRFLGVSIITPSYEIIDLVEGEDYTYIIEDTETEYNETVVIDNWGEFITSGEARYTNKMVFNFETNPSIIKFLARKNGVLYHYSSWDNEFGDEFKINLRLNGIPIVPPNNSDNNLSPISYENGDMFLFIDNPQLNPTLEMDFSGSLIKREIESKYRVGNKKYTKTIDVISNTEASDIINFSYAEYIIDLDNIEKYISIKSGRNIVCDTSGLVSINYNSSKSIRFGVSSGYTFSIDFVNFRYNENDRLIKYENSISIASPTNTILYLNGNPTVNISITPYGVNRYYIDLSNVVENVMIQITAIKIE